MEYKDRKKDILDILYANGRVSVLQLAKTLFVSEILRKNSLAMRFLNIARGFLVIVNFQ